MKKVVIQKYYGFLMWLEDILSVPSDIVHKHRVRIDERYWEAMLRLKSLFGRNNFESRSKFNDVE